MIPGFRKTANNYEVYSKLIGLSRKKRQGLFWQSAANGNKILSKGIIIRVSQAEKMAVVQFESPEDAKIFSVSQSLNAYFDEEKFLFAIKAFFIQDDLLYLELPQEAFASEARIRPRSSLRNLRGDLTMEFSLGGRGQVSTIFKLRLLDLSAAGSGLIDPGARTKKFIKQNDVISIQRICGQGLDRPLIAKIAYIKDIVDPRTPELNDIRRIGIKFYKEIDPYKFIIPFLEKKAKL